MLLLLSINTIVVIINLNTPKFWFCNRLLATHLEVQGTVNRSEVIGLIMMWANPILVFGWRSGEEQLQTEKLSSRTNRWHEKFSGKKNETSHFMVVRQIPMLVYTWFDVTAIWQTVHPPDWVFLETLSHSVCAAYQDFFNQSKSRNISLFKYWCTLQTATSWSLHHFPSSIVVFYQSPCLENAEQSLQQCSRGKSSRWTQKYGVCLHFGGYGPWQVLQSSDQGSEAAPGLHSRGPGTFSERKLLLNHMSSHLAGWILVRTKQDVSLQSWARFRGM